MGFLPARAGIWDYQSCRARGPWLPDSSHSSKVACVRAFSRFVRQSALGTVIAPQFAPKGTVTVQRT